VRVTVIAGLRVRVRIRIRVKVRVRARKMRVRDEVKAGVREGEWW
jgi:hypothetical protein